MGAVQAAREPENEKPEHRLTKRVVHIRHVARGTRDSLFFTTIFVILSFLSI